MSPLSDIIMAEHAGQKRAAVKFLNRGKKVDEHRAKGKETASDAPEDAHEAVRRGTGHNMPMRTSSISLHSLHLIPVLLLVACCAGHRGAVRIDSFYTESGYDKVTVRQGSSSGTNMSEFSRIYVYFSSANIQTRNTIASACPVVGKACAGTSGCFITRNSCCASGQ